MHKVPILKILLPYIAGIIFARCVQTPTVLLYSASISLFMFVFLFYFFNRLRLFALCAFLLLFVAGILIYQGSGQIKKTDCSHMADLPVLTAIRGTVVSPVSERDESIRSVLRADSVWIQGVRYPVSGKVLLNWYDPGPLRYGDEIIAKGKLRLPSRDRNPGDFNYREYLAVRHIHSIFSVKNNMDLLILERDQASWVMSHIVIPCRRYALFFFNQLDGGEMSAFAAALIIGERGGLSSDMKNSFARSGIIHILAVSGLHVGFLWTMLTAMFQLLRIKNPWRVVLIIGCLVFYAALTGFKVPVVRATLMAVILMIGTVIQRPGYSLNSMAMAALVLLLIQPLHLFQAGFQLSFAAVTGILLFYKKFKTLAQGWLLNARENGQIRFYLVGLLLVSASAQFATLPLTAYYFNRIPTLALLMNLVALPLAGVIVSTAFLALGLSVLFWPIGWMLGQVMWLFTKLLLIITQATGSLWFVSLDVAQPKLWHIAAYYLILGLLVFWQERRYRFAAIGTVLILANLSLWFRNFSKQDILSIDFLDVGQGDSAVLMFDNHSVVVVDAGDSSEKYDCGESIVGPFLKRRGIDHIDLLILTHFHSDHTGGAEYLLNHFHIDTLAMPNQPEHKEFIKYQRFAAENSIPTKGLERGDILKGYGKPVLLVLNPGKHMLQDTTSNINDVSLVILCKYKTGSVLLTGDAEIAAEQEMSVYQRLLDVDVLKIGHHGSATASSHAFRERVDAECGVVSVGAFNRFGLPSEFRLEQFEIEGTKILRTDLNGAVRVQIQEQGLIVDSHF
ncbi:MAG: DNA internalization-related competence protein ComEC/Rec2 [candidate division KSB1 bacterium]|nr:DNA internalization-related competence protein ComEC/Rec2 [candidate division KSB1 bacterium]